MISGNLRWRQITQSQSDFVLINKKQKKRTWYLVDFAVRETVPERSEKRLAELEIRGRIQTIPTIVNID